LASTWMLASDTPNAGSALMPKRTRFSRSFSVLCAWSQASAASTWGPSEGSAGDFLGLAGISSPLLDPPPKRGEDEKQQQQTTTDASNSGRDPRRQQLGQAIVARRDSLFHRGGEDAVAGFLRLVEDRQGHRRTAVLFHQQRRVERLAGIPGVVEHLRLDDPLGSRDLLENAAHPHPGFALLPDVAIGAPFPEIDFAHRHLPALRAEQPALEQLGAGHRLEHQLARGIEDAGHDDLAIG